MKYLKKQTWKLLNQLKTGGVVQLLVKSDLKQKGWFRSFHSKASVGRNGEPIPWITYPALRFLESRLRADLTAFEYGSGHSTLWFAERVEQIRSVEYDQVWLQKISPQLPSNAEILYRSLTDAVAYAGAPNHFKQHFDIVIIDGRNRVGCAQVAPEVLSERGVIIFDNTDRPDYAVGYRHLADQGFRRLDFWGMVPIVADESCTSIFYREGNCLGI